MQAKKAERNLALFGVLMVIIMLVVFVFWFDRPTSLNLKIDKHFDTIITEVRNGHGVHAYSTQDGSSDLSADLREEPAFKVLLSRPASDPTRGEMKLRFSSIFSGRTALVQLKVANLDGGAILVEVSPNGTVRITPEGGVLLNGKSELLELRFGRTF